MYSESQSFYRINWRGRRRGIVVLLKTCICGTLLYVLFNKFLQERWKQVLRCALRIICVHVVCFRVVQSLAVFHRRSYCNEVLIQLNSSSLHIRGTLLARSTNIRPPLLQSLILTFPVLHFSTSCSTAQLPLLPTSSLPSPSCALRILYFYSVLMQSSSAIYFPEGLILYYTTIYLTTYSFFVVFTLDLPQ